MQAILIFALIFVLKLAESGCPSTCTCYNASVSCISQNLECAPNFDSLENTPTIIDISGNKIQIITPNDFSFDKAIDVLELYLNNSRIADIEANTFDELENLQNLYLGGNLLSSLPENLTSKQENLILLDISNNYFEDAMPKLRSKSLEVLAIANSKISVVPQDVLAGLPNLKVLLLQQNSISKMSYTIFRGLSSFSFVHLALNPWKCNCETIDLFDYLTSMGYIDAGEAMECSTGDQKFFYDNGVIANFKEKCKKSVSVDLDILEFKEAKMVKDLARQDNNKENEMQNDSASGKPYSLIIEKQNETQIFENKEIIIEGNCKTWTSLNWFIILAVVLSFMVGGLMGFGFHYFLISRRRELVITDSTAKLIGA